MNKFTKLIALVLVVLTTLSLLVACGPNEDPEVTTTTAVTTLDNGVTTKAGESTTKSKDDKTKKPQKDEKTTGIADAKVPPGYSTHGTLITRTTNRAGAASDKFVKSLKGFTLKIFYPWPNIYGDSKCEKLAKDSISSVEKEFNVKIVEEGQFNKYNEQLASELAARKCDYHIYFAQGGFFPSYFEKGYIADLTTAMRETGVDFSDVWYISDAKGFLNIDGKQYGWIPYEDEYTTPHCIIYNKKLLKNKLKGAFKDPAELAKQGKWTWDVMEKYAKKFADDKTVDGFISVNNLNLLAAIANQKGAALTKVSRGAQPTTNIGDSKVKSALTTLSEWTTGKQKWIETYYDKTWTYGKTQFQEGKAAMLYGSHDAIQGLKGTSVQKDVGIAPFPTEKGSKNYTGISEASFIAFIPNVWQKEASKILFIRNEYYRYNYRFVNRCFQYKWESYLGRNKEAITNAANIKFATNGNRIKFCWTSVCESDGASVTTNSIISDVVRGKSTAAQAITSKKKALANTYADVWSGHEITGNV